MKQLKLNVSKRAATGTRNAKRLRAAGSVPAIIYGKSGANALSIDDLALRKMLREIKGESALIQINDGESERLTVLKTYHRCSTTDQFIHVDFQEISADQPIHLSLPVHVEGESIGVKNENGILQFLEHTLAVKALPSKIPAYIAVNVDNLHVGESIFVKDLAAIEGLIYEGSPDTVIVACSQPAAARSEKLEDEEGGEEASTDKEEENTEPKA